MTVQKFTDRIVRAMKPAETVQNLTDEKVTGLELRISIRGRKSWSVRYRRHSDRKYRRITMGVFPIMTVEEARAKAIEILRNAATGGDPAGDKSSPRETLTVAHFAEQYVDRYARQKKKSWRNDKRTLEREVIPYLGSMRLVAVRRPDIVEILDRIYDRGVPHAALNTQSILSRMFNYALEREQVDFNPVAGIKSYAVKRSRDRVLTDTEIAAFLSVLDRTDMQCAFKDVLRLCLLCGQRVSEIAELPKIEVDLDADHPEWVIPTWRAKNKRANAVPLSPQAVAIIAPRLATASRYVFPCERSRSDNPVMRDQIAPELVKLIARNGFARFTAHDLRRSVFTGIVRLGFSVTVAGKIANHSEASRGISATYDRYNYLEETRGALQAWGAHVEKLTARKAGQQ